MNLPLQHPDAVARLKAPKPARVPKARGRA